jgi:hypothetical protein
MAELLARDSIDEDTDLESLLSSQSKRLRELIDRGILSGWRKGLTSFGDLPD